MRGKGPITEAEKAEMVRLAREGVSQHEVAKRVGCSRTTVEKWVRVLAPDHEWDREATAKAVRAHQVDLAAMRAALQVKALQRADRALDRMAEPYTYWATVVDRDGKVHQIPRTEPEPGPKETSLLTAAHKALVFTESKIQEDQRAAEAASAGSVSEFDAWLTAMTGAPVNPNTTGTGDTL